MIRGMYTAAANMVAQSLRQEAISNNLANLNTSGYKGDRLAFRARMEQALSRESKQERAAVGGLSTGVWASEQAISFEQGNLRQTENPLDLAIDGEGFFAVSKNGETLYTRNGSFRRSQDGFLTDGEGNRVLGLTGPIKLPNEKIEISPRGILSIKGKPVARLRLVAFDQPQEQLEKVGASYFRLDSGAARAARGLVSQGTLEGANVDAVREMVDMISAMRSYEASQRMIQVQDESLGRAISEVAR